MQSFKEEEEDILSSLNTLSNTPVFPLNSLLFHNRFSLLLLLFFREKIFLPAFCLAVFSGLLLFFFVKMCVGVFFLFFAFFLQALVYFDNTGERNK